jgi:enoyl-CoA hydratase/carnithine racemase
MPQTSDDLVLCEISEGVALLTLNRPEQMNGWTREMEVRYFDLLDQLDDDPAVRALIVTGAGRGFCPGLDLAALREVSQGPGGTWKPARPMSHPLGVRKPLIAAINGGCAGVGFMQALVCDLRFAARGAKLATSFAARGLPAEFGVTWLLPRLVGYGNALDLLLSGRAIGADEALEMGLVQRVFEPEELLPRTREYARGLAANCSPTAMASIKAQVAADWTRSHPESYADAAALVVDPRRRIDFAEGVAAYTERRAPRFRPLPNRREWS